MVPLAEGTLLGPCRIVRLLSSGAVGDVYLGEQDDLGRQVAVKVLREYGAGETSEEARARTVAQFTQEARAIAALEHPNIVPIYQFGEQDGIYYLVMQYIADGSLADLMSARSQNPLFHLPCAPTVMLPIVTSAAAALQYAHDRHLMHLDVKPHNLLIKLLGSDVSAGGQAAPFHVFLTDFGLAQLMTFQSFQSGMTGTPLYTAPEQYQQRPTPASDQYALACVAYQLLTGMPPFSGGLAELHHQHLQVPPPPITTRNPALPPALNPVFATALAKDPAQRFPSVSAFAQALSGVFVTASAGAAPPLPLNLPPDVPRPAGPPPIMPPRPSAPPVGAAPGPQVAPPMPSPVPGYPAQNYPPQGYPAGSYAAGGYPTGALPAMPPTPLAQQATGGLVYDEPTQPLPRRPNPALQWVLDLPRPVSIGSGVSIVLVIVLLSLLVARLNAKPAAVARPIFSVLYQKPLLGAPGVRPVVSNGTVYVVGRDGKLYALDADTGQEKWHYTTNSTLVAGVTLGTDGTIYLPGGDGNLYALSSDGNLLWKYPFSSGFVTTPVIFSDFISVGTESGTFLQLILSTCPQGCKLSSYFLANGSFANESSLNKDTIYIGNANHRLYAYTMSRGALAWSADAKAAIRGGTTFNDRSVFVGTENGTLSAFDIAHGKQQWSLTFGGAIDAQPIVNGGNVYVAAKDGVLYAVDAYQAGKIWTTDLGEPVSNDMLLMNADIMAFTDNGTVMKVDANTGAILGKEGLNQTISTPPTLDGDRIYVCGNGFFEVLKVNS